MASLLVADHGWRVVFVTSGPRGSSTEMGELGGCRVYRVPAQLTLSRTPLSADWPRRLSTIAREEQAVLINAHAPVPGMADAAALAKGRLPLVLTYHAGPMRKGRALADRAIWLYEQTALGYTARRADAVICNSTYVQQVFGRHFADRSVVIPPGVDVGAFQPGGPARPGAILFVAQLDAGMEFKGLDTLLESVAVLVAGGADVTVEVVGSGSLVPGYRRQASRLGLGPDRVRFSGHLAGAELLAAYHRSSVAALPSGNESFGMFLAEAMACGLPVVASRTGGIPDVVEDGETGLLVTHGVVADLAAALSKVVDDPGLAHRLGRAGRQRAEREFAWSDRARATHRGVHAHPRPPGRDPLGPARRPPDGVEHDRTPVGRRSTRPGGRFRSGRSGPSSPPTPQGRPGHLALSPRARGHGTGRRRDVRGPGRRAR